ncbi:4560_t:CDS:2, partial [Cetraspora pellucida]
MAYYSNIEEIENIPETKPSESESLEDESDDYHTYEQENTIANNNFIKEQLFYRKIIENYLAEVLQCEEKFIPANTINLENSYNKKNTSSDIQLKNLLKVVIK